jgi:hypothetical protein
MDCKQKSYLSLLTVARGSSKLSLPLSRRFEGDFCLIESHNMKKKKTLGPQVATQKDNVLGKHE